MYINRMKQSKRECFRTRWKKGWIKAIKWEMMWSFGERRNERSWKTGAVNDYVEKLFFNVEALAKQNVLIQMSDVTNGGKRELESNPRLCAGFAH